MSDIVVVGGLFGSIGKGLGAFMTKPTRKKIEAKMSAKLGRTVHMPTPTVTLKDVGKGLVKTTIIAASVASLAVPGLNVAGAASLAGVAVAADKVIAAVEKGGKVAKQAKQVYDTTKALADQGHPDAQRAMSILSSVAADRVKKAIPKGVERAVPASAAAHFAAFVKAPKLTPQNAPKPVANAKAAAAKAKVRPKPAAPKPPSSAPAAPATAGMLIAVQSDGRLSFSQGRWRAA